MSSDMLYLAIAFSPFLFFWFMGTLIWFLWWCFPISISVSPNRRRQLQMAWLTPIWPLVLLVMGIRRTPRLGRAIVASLREAFGPVKRKPTPPPLPWMTINQMREKVGVPPTEPATEPVQPTPGRWEQP